MGTTQVMATPGAPAQNESGAEPKPRRVRKTVSEPRPSGKARYFLGTDSTDGKAVGLGEEFTGEAEVLVASLKHDLPFYRIETFRAQAEKRGRRMVITRRS